MVQVLEKKAIDSISFDRNDISSVANARYFRKSGMRVLLIWAFVTLLITVIHNFFGFMPDLVAYILFGLNALVFVWLYSSKQAEVREKLWARIEADRMAKQEAINASRN